MGGRERGFGLEVEYGVPRTTKMKMKMKKMMMD